MVALMNTGKVKVWDSAVRVFHWSLVIFFTLSYLTGDEESSLHNNAGYIVLGLVAFRLFWGLVGTRHARFSDFIYGPGTTIDYARSLLAGNPRRYVGHNPLGSWMIVALLVSILITCWSGIEYIGSKGQGPLAGDGVEVITMALADDDKRAYAEAHHEEGDKFWEETHEIFANISIVLVIVHILGVVVASRLHRENLIRAMITGYKEQGHK
jgi:cytochrome b